MTNPFDDPELQAFMQANGIPHSPGLADEMMRELKPLLVEEGVDLDDLSNVDLDTMNAAMATATERRNMMMSTPVGAHRDASLALLRDVAVAIAGGDQAAAADILGTIGPDPIRDMPSVAQVLGVATGMLDDWSRDPSVRPHLVGARPTKTWHQRASRAAAADVLALASKGRAFGSLTPLIAKHGGLAVLEGSALAVATTLADWALQCGSDVPALGRQVLTTGDAPRPASGNPFRRATPSTGSAFRRPTPTRQSEHDLIDRFGMWLADEGLDDDDFDEVHDLVTWLIDLAGVAGADPADADDMWELLKRVDDEFTGEMRDDALDAMHHLIHFHLKVSSQPALWEDLHAEVGDLESGQADIRAAIAGAMVIGEDVPDEQRRASAARTSVVSAVRELLDWIGSGRPSAAHGVKRADIAHVASLLGIRAEGVSVLPAPEPLSLTERDLSKPYPEPRIHSVQSMIDVPVLSEWWSALDTCGLITRLKTRVKPGQNAELWLSEDLPPLDEAEMVITFFVATMLTDQSRYEYAAMYDNANALLVIRHLAAALAPDVLDPPAPLHPLNSRALRDVERLVRLGLVEHARDGRYVVPDAIQLPVARGVAIANSFLAGEFSEE